MIISQGRRYIFVHIPKTGGTSMALALEARAMKDDVMIGDTPKARRRRRRINVGKARGRVWKHATLADIDGLYAAEDLAPLFAFTLVRNPWDRLVSYYCWLRRQSFEHPAVRLAQSVDFNRFLQDTQTQTSLQASHYSRYMTRADGVEQCQAYIRLEHFEKDSAGLQAHLGFPLVLERINRSDRAADYRRYFSDDGAALVGRICASDIIRFGYGFDDGPLF